MGDPEIEAMAAVAAALDALDGDARRRVLRWAADRFDVADAVSDGGSSERGDADDGKHDGDGKDAPPHRFEHFAELFAQAQPKSDIDKVLVAAYWLQAIQGHQTWQSAALQKELKNLGHVVGHVSQALTSNMQKKPQRIIQLQKAGNTQQARKTYKVTHAGIEYVESMLGRGDA